MEDCHIENYADDNLVYSSGKNVEEVLNTLENVSSNLLQWFADKESERNPSKCYLLIRSGKNVHINIGTSHIKNSSYERLLRIDIDCNMLLMSSFFKSQFIAHYHGCFIARNFKQQDK